MPLHKILLRLAAIVGFGLALSACYYHAPGGHYAYDRGYSYKAYPDRGYGHRDHHGHGQKSRGRYDHRPHRGRHY